MTSTTLATTLANTTASPCIHGYGTNGYGCCDMYEGWSVELMDEHQCFGNLINNI
jgi:hypothetical protein